MTKYFHNFFSYSLKADRNTIERIRQSDIHETCCLRELASIENLHEKKKEEKKRIKIFIHSPLCVFRYEFEQRGMGCVEGYRGVGRKRVKSSGARTGRGCADCYGNPASGIRIMMRVTV